MRNAGMWKLLLLLLMTVPAFSWCPQQCRCQHDVTDQLEVYCPHNEDSARLILNVKPGETVKIQCNNASALDWTLVDDLRTEAVPYVEITRCPPPPSNLTQLFNVTKVQKFVYSSFMNLTESIETDIFNGMQDLQTLDLHSNGLRVLPGDLLSHLSSLQSLNLRDNQLRVLASDFFSEARNLTRLELGNNLLEDLEPGLLRNLSNLLLLNIWGNRLKYLETSYFIGLSNLTSLDVNSNQLSYLSGDVFREIGTLKELNLGNNNFSALDAGIFKWTPHLEVLRWNDNHGKLVLPGALFAGLTQLKQVFLGRSGVETLPDDLFSGAHALLCLYLQGNAITHIPVRLLEDQRKLERLDLSHNLLASIGGGAFQHLASLTHLILSYNRLAAIQKDTFRGLKNLVMIDLRHNELSVIHDVAFYELKSLREAQLSNNRLSFLNEDGFVQGGIRIMDYYGNSSPLRHCTDLEHLYLGNNTVREMFQDWRFIMLKLKTLDLSYNNFTLLNGGDLTFLSGNVLVDLQHNMIRTVEVLWVLEAGGEPQRDQPVPKVLLSHNPINCDCQSYDLGLYANYKLPSPVYGRLRLELDHVRCASPPALRDRELTSVTLPEYLCLLPEDLGCPKRCECAFRKYDRALVVNCAHLGLREAPKSLPYLAVSNHTELWLVHNELTTIPNATSPGYANVTHLFLSHNKISNFTADLISVKLRMLSLNHNNLTILDGSTLKKMDEVALKEVSLHGNPWKCDCTNRELLTWMQPRFKKINFFNNVTCSDGRLFSKLSPGELCPTNLLTFSLGMMFFMALLVAFVIIYYGYLHNIKVWMFAHQCCMCLVTEDELDKDKRFDAFVSFSHKDEDFVVEELVPRLEASGLTLCLHYRDWVAGEWIPNQIARSVEASRRTLVVLSPSFIESVWGRMEFRVAHKQALSEGRARVVMLLYGDIPATDQLDPELRSYITMNTYVKWGDPWFWDKLRYALPHAPLPPKKTTKLDERIELMHPGLSPATTPTTPVHTGILPFTITPSPKSAVA